MKKQLAKPLVLLFFFLSLTFCTYAQLREQGLPYSFKNPVPENEEVVTMSSINIEKLKKEDTDNIGKNIPFRFGHTFDVNYSTENSGKWYALPNGDMLWKLSIESKGAYSINLGFGKYNLPEGAKLFIYNASKKSYLGAYTSKNNQADGLFGIQPIAGDKIILEYYEPASAKGKGVLQLEKVTHAYKSILQSEAYGYGNSEYCHVNINCTDGNDWQDQKRSAVLILADGGLCSGAVINNAKGDGKPYVLTADHCYSGSVSTWVYVFNYESPNCTNTEGVTNNTVTGSTLRARNEDSDFLLTELSSTPPLSYNVYYAGWSKSNSTPSSAAGIHHPAGDIKKISKKSTALSLDTWSSGVNDHWLISGWTSGSTEGGSSGSPLFNQNKLIIGQLHGGTSTICPASSKTSYYGALFASWEGGGTSATRLKDWLDPDNTGVTSVNGAYIGQNPCTAPPTAGTTTASLNPVCPGNTFSLSLTGNSIGIGQTYQWQNSANGSTWAAISGATNTTYSTSQSTDTYYRCIVTCSGNSTSSSSLFVTTVTTGCNYNMTANSTTSISACSGVLYDDGLTSNYTSEQTSVMTIYPGTPGLKASLAFTSFLLEEDFDYLYIYDGTSTSAPLIDVYSGTMSPGTITATGTSGALTLELYTDESVVYSGFAATISCSGTLCTAPPTGGSTVSNKASVCSGETITLSLSGTSSGGGLTYQWQSSTSGTTWTSISGATNYTYSTTQTANTYYRCVLTCGGISANSSSTYVTSTTTGCSYTMTANTISSISTCNGTLYDNGGTSNYTPSQNSVITINPSTAGYKVSLNFSSFNLESSYDYLYIYDGTSTSATLINSYTGTSSPGTITATSASGALTLRFTSDGSFQYSGFVASISCTGTPCASPPTAGTAVSNASSVCSGLPFNLSLSGSSSGGGLTYQWQKSSNGVVWANITDATNSTLTTSQIANTQYRCVLTCSGVNSNSGSVTVSNSTSGCTYDMVANDVTSITTCSGTLYDDGGNFNYTGNQTSTLTINPGTPGAKVILNFTLFDLEYDYDYLSIYNGTSTSAPLLGEYTGSDSPGIVTATGSSGALTLYFTSDWSLQYAGFAASITCTNPPVASLQNSTATEALVVFPNPTTGLCLIKTSLNSQDAIRYELCNVLGEINESGVLVKSSSSESELNLGHIAPGVYTLHLKSGEKIATTKIIIAR